VQLSESGTGTDRRRQNGRVIVDCALYREGSRAEETRNVLRLAAEARHDPSAFVWMGLLEPTETDLLGVSRVFGLHELAVEDAVQAHQRPKVDTYRDHLFVVLRTLTYDDATSAVETGEVALFVGTDFVVTVRHGVGQELSAVRQRLEADPEVLAHGPSAVLYGVADAVVDTYLDVAKALQTDLDGLETAVFSQHFSDAFEQIYTLKRELLELRRAASPLAQALQQVQGSRLAFVPEEVRPFFRDVTDHLARVAEQIESMDLLLSSILQAHLAQVGLRQNSDMRKITSWAAILAVPTAIAGIYGMNFSHMPELSWAFGYPLVMAVMAVICLGLYRAFKRSGWL
jgi:magnesium transporter